MVVEEKRGAHEILGDGNAELFLGRCDQVFISSRLVYTTAILILRIHVLYQRRPEGVNGREGRGRREGGREL